MFIGRGMEMLQSLTSRPKLLLVDDEPRNLQLLRQILKDQYDLFYAKSGSDALVAAVKNRPDMVLLDIMMPGMDGYQVCEQLKRDRRTSTIAVIFVSAMSDEEDESRGLELGAVDYITKPLRASVVRQRVHTHLLLRNQQASCQQTIDRQYNELRYTRLQSLMMLGKAAEFKDNETGMHVQRMARYSELLARSYGWNGSACELMLHAAPMHDVGKIGTPDHILLKPARLNAEEWRVMQQHTLHGAEIIGQCGCETELFAMARSIALTHHEKWDGSGYPYGLSGETIPIEGRIVALADVFDALTTRRPYKEAWPVEQAVNYLKEEVGRHFDPDLVPLFLAQLPQVLEIRQRWQDR